MQELFIRVATELCKGSQEVGPTYHVCVTTLCVRALCVPVCARACIHVRMSASVCACVRVCVCACVCTCACACLRACLCVCVRMGVRVLAYIHVYTGIKTCEHIHDNEVCFQNTGACFSPDSPAYVCCAHPRENMKTQPNLSNEIQHKTIIKGLVLLSS